MNTLFKIYMKEGSLNSNLNTCSSKKKNKDNMIKQLESKYGESNYGIKEKGVTIKNKNCNNDV